MNFHWQTALLTAGVFLILVVLFAIGVYLYNKGQMVVRKERESLQYGAFDLSDSDDEEPVAKRKRRVDGHVQENKYRRKTNDVDDLISSFANTGTTQRVNPNEPLQIGATVRLKQSSDFLKEGEPVIIKSIHYKSDRPCIDDNVTIIPPPNVRKIVPDMLVSRALFIPTAEATELYKELWDKKIANINVEQDYMET